MKDFFKSMASALVLATGVFAISTVASYILMAPQMPGGEWSFLVAGLLALVVGSILTALVMLLAFAYFLGSLDPLDDLTPDLGNIDEGESVYTDGVVTLGEDGPNLGEREQRDDEPSGPTASSAKGSSVNAATTTETSGFEVTD